MPINAAIVREDAETGQRRDERIQVLFEVPGSGAPEDGIRAIVHNLSVSGLLLETEFALVLGQTFQVTLPEAGNVAATVVWQSEAYAGCSFDRPLTAAELEAVQLHFPPPEKGDSESEAQADQALETLAGNLQRLREDRGLSRAQLAGFSGLSTPSIWAWENGRTVPRKKSLLALAIALGISENDFSERKDFRLEETTASQEWLEESELRKSVESSKERIAKVAGVSVSNIRIHIEY
ncbi:helix-turn-helix domain-containing protein [Sphingorhabdus soli]|uniref:Helix-turn-helix domain-containing protein n=1 Tax=Flavisphingopyxis soli TaxID=2601267 RepID=A0A5C6UJX2_9SPHN|nr:helix-turn-helix domain-containing protein [Sphingorhabdus soli]TXC73273.1 helix-turn-helix domain-containing protein [Sphingorhabdus soli]